MNLITNIKKTLIGKYRLIGNSESFSKNLWIFLLFSFIFSANLLYQFSFKHPKAVFAYDGHYYFATCSSIVNYIRAIMHGNFTPSMLFEPEFVRNITVNGPVIPGLPAIILLWLGRDISTTDWPILVVFLTVLQSISSCLVAIICQRITSSKIAGFIAGILFGLYPPSLIATGMFLSEVPAITLELLFIICLTLSSRKIIFGILASIIGVMLWFAKSALMPVVILSIIVAAWQSPKHFKLLVCMLMTCTLIILPWIIYVKTVYGGISLTPIRYPRINAAVGCDLQTDGWCVYPPTKWQEPAEGTPSSIILGQWQKYPRSMLVLTIKKITRLFAFPWNSYREKVFGITAKNQQYIHTLILCFCIFGIFIYLIEQDISLDKEASSLANLGLIMILGHFIYLLFQPSGRYLYTAIPFLLIYGVYGIFCVWKKKLNSRILYSCILLSIFSVWFISTAEALMDIGKPIETSHKIDTGTSVEKHIELRSINVSAKSLKALLLIDTDDQLIGAQVKINGHLLKDPPYLAYNFSNALYSFLRGFREQCHIMKTSVYNLRQWRIIPVPVSWLNLDRNNVIELETVDHSFKIFGDSKETQDMPSPNYTSPTLFFTTMGGQELRVKEYSLAEPMSQKSFIKNTRSNSSTILNDSLRIRLALIPQYGNEKGEVKNIKELDQCTLKLDFKKCHIFAQDPTCSGIKVNRYLLGYIGGIFNKIEIPTLTSSSHIEFKISGDYRILKGPGNVSISANVLGSKNQDQNLGLIPNSMAGDHDWKHFEMDDLLPVETIGYPLKQITIGLWPLPWLDAQYGPSKECSEAQFKNIQIEIHTKDFSNLSQDQTIYF